MRRVSEHVGSTAPALSCGEADRRAAALRAEEFPGFARVSYLDHALRGPVPLRAVAAARAALEACAEGAAARAEQGRAIEAAREGLGRLLGWPSTCVAFVANTTAAVGALAQAVEWSRGERVLVHADEVPSNVLPWRALDRHGVGVEVLPSRGGRLALEDVEEALRRGGVRLMSFAVVSLDTGQRRDLGALGRLAREHGALLCADAAQALGALQLDLSGVDAVFGSGRKWLLGPPEVGILAIRPGLSASLSPPAPGALALDASGAWRAEAGRFEGGALPAVALAGLAASLSLHGELGAAEVERRVLTLATEAAERAAGIGLRVTSPGGAERAGLVHLRRPEGVTPGRWAALEADLRARGVVARVLEGGLRLSPHAWNSPEDLERAFEALAVLLRR